MICNHNLSILKRENSIISVENIYYSVDEKYGICKLDSWNKYGFRCPGDYTDYLVIANLGSAPWGPELGAEEGPGDYTCILIFSIGGLFICFMCQMKCVAGGRGAPPIRGQNSKGQDRGIFPKLDICDLYQ